MTGMQFIIKNLRRSLILLLPFAGFSQSVFLPQGNKHTQLLDRLEIKFSHNPDLNLSVAKPLSRRLAVQVAEDADSSSLILLSNVDEYNIHSLLMNNSEWVKGDKSSFVSRKSIWNTFYKTRANFFEVNQKDFFLAVNPVFQFQQSLEQDNDERIFLNSRGGT